MKSLDIQVLLSFSVCIPIYITMQKSLHVKYILREIVFINTRPNRGGRERMDETERKERNKGCQGGCDVLTEKSWNIKKILWSSWDASFPPRLIWLSHTSHHTYFMMYMGSKTFLFFKLYKGSQCICVWAEKWKG